MRPENPSDRKFFCPQLRLYDPCTHTNVSFSKILTHYAENEHFPPPIPRSLLSAAPCDIVIGHGHERGLGQGQISRYPGGYSQFIGIMEQGDNSLRGWG